MTDKTKKDAQDAVENALSLLRAHAGPLADSLVVEEVPALAEGKASKDDITTAVAALKDLSTALAEAEVLPAADVAGGLDAVSDALRLAGDGGLTEPLASTVATARKAIEPLRKNDATTAPKPAPAADPTIEDRMLAVSEIIPTTDAVIGGDETWKGALCLPAEHGTACLSFSVPPPAMELLSALGKRGAPWLVDVENNEENRAWLSLLARVFRVKTFPVQGRVFAASFDPKGEIEWLDRELAVKRLYVGKAEETASEERYVLGVVLEPETEDTQHDIYSADTIRSAAHKFMEDFGNLGLMHKVNVSGKARVLESYIAPVAFKVGGQAIKKGTWMLAVRVLDDELWKAIKGGELTGFSIGGSAIRRPEDAAA